MELSWNCHGKGGLIVSRAKTWLTKLIFMEKVKFKENMLHLHQ